MLLNSSLFLEELEACKLIMKNVKNNNGDLKKKKDTVLVAEKKWKPSSPKTKFPH